MSTSLASLQQRLAKVAERLQERGGPPLASLTTRELREFLCSGLGLSETELAELAPSGELRRLLAAEFERRGLTAPAAQPSRPQP